MNALISRGKELNRCPTICHFFRILSKHPCQIFLGIEVETEYCSIRSIRIPV